MTPFPSPASSSTVTTDPMARLPTTTTLARTPSSIRRTSHMDMLPRGATIEAGVELLGGVRDLRTEPDGRGVILAQAQISALVGPGRILERLETTPTDDATKALIGIAVASGFRGAVDRALPEQRAAHTPLYLLLDELPVASLIAGYTDLYSRKPGEAESELRIAAQRSKADICAGWASDATMMVAIARDGRMPTPIGPEAPPLESSDDPLGWHAIPRLAPNSMRRRRRIDLIAGRPLRIDAMFRDSHVGPDGIETALHEYSLEATVDPDTLVVEHCLARPRVLPWSECPRAADSATRLVGHRLATLRDFVRRDLVGTSTCTHLNDLLRSIADCSAMSQWLARTAEDPR